MNENLFFDDDNVHYHLYYFVVDYLLEMIFHDLDEYQTYFAIEIKLRINLIEEMILISRINKLSEKQ